MTKQTNRPDLRLSELLILAVFWMVFGFMLWYYLSAFHGVPVRLTGQRDSEISAG